MIQDKQINLGSYSLISTIKSVALIVALVVVGIMYFNERETRIEQETLIEASVDTLEVWKNKNGENLAKIQVLETRNEKTFLAFESQDKTIQELQKLVKQNRNLFKNSKGTAGIIKSETEIKATGDTQVSQEASGSPIYSSTIVDKWYKIESKATKDSTSITLNTFHNISLVMGSESQGLFKKKKSYATAKDDNPYSNIKDMRIYNVTEDRKNFVIGPFVGLGIGGSQGIIRTGWQVGFGIIYKLFEL
jgi:hypothetical protein